MTLNSKNPGSEGICFVESILTERNSKYQIPNTKQISMTKIRKSKECFVLKGFGHCILEFKIYPPEAR